MCFSSALGARGRLGLSALLCVAVLLLFPALALLPPMLRMAVLHVSALTTSLLIAMDLLVRSIALGMSGERGLDAPPSLAANKELTLALELKR